jgi:hypothetical protein
MDEPDALAALEAQLGETPPPGVARLEPQHLEHLAAAIRAARHRQAAELQAAGEQAFGYIPRLLRGPIRRMLG